jgi:hypothetical protein
MYLSLQAIDYKLVRWRRGWDSNPHLPFILCKLLKPRIAHTAHTAQIAGFTHKIHTRHLVRNFSCHHSPFLQATFQSTTSFVAETLQDQASSGIVYGARYIRSPPRNTLLPSSSVITCSASGSKRSVLPRQGLTWSLEVLGQLIRSISDCIATGQAVTTAYGSRGLCATEVHGRG